MIRRLSAAITLAVVMASGVAPADADPAPLTIWISPEGRDAGGMGTAQKPWRTLQKVHNVLCPSQPCPGKGRPVEIRMAPGLYRMTATVNWSYFDDTYPTRFVPWSWQPGWTYAKAKAAPHPADYVLPTIDGEYKTAWAMTFSPTREPTVGTNMEWQYLVWQRFVRGGLLIGPATAQQDQYTWRFRHNLLYANQFLKIGSAFSKASQMGYSGVSLLHVEDSVVKGNTFADILNTGVGYGHEHAVYMVRSSNNHVVSNRLTNVGGDPIRVRDESNRNSVTANTFTRTGQFGYIGDWYCKDTACPASVLFPQQTTEHKSSGNVFTGNTLNGPHPKHNRQFVTRFCFDLPGLCPSSRISGQ